MLVATHCGAVVAEYIGEDYIQQRTRLLYMYEATLIRSAIATHVTFDESEVAISIT